MKPLHVFLKKPDSYGHSIKNVMGYYMSAFFHFGYDAIGHIKSDIYFRIRDSVRIKK